MISSSRRESSLGTTTASIDSSRMSSGTPMTAQSNTLACSRIAASTSLAATFSPARLIMSLARSTKW